MPNTPKSSRSFIDARFGEIWPVHVEGFTRLLILLRREFDGDLDMMLVMAVIGEATLPKHSLPANFEYGKLLEGKGLLIAKEDINTQSIAAFSGIPRETVCRKLEKLARNGWIERNEAGGWSATRRASSNLHGATEASLDYLASLRLVLIDRD